MIIHVRQLMPVLTLFAAGYSACLSFAGTYTFYKFRKSEIKPNAALQIKRTILFHSLCSLRMIIFTILYKTKISTDFIVSLMIIYTITIICIELSQKNFILKWHDFKRFLIEQKTWAFLKNLLNHNAISVLPLAPDRADWPQYQVKVVDVFQVWSDSASSYSPLIRSFRRP